jgi:hypothetical protein
MKMENRGYKFLVRQVEAWADPDGGWTYNNVWNIGEFVTRAKNIPVALTSWLKRNHGIVFIQNRVRIWTDGDNYEIVDRKTGEPIFDAIFIPW